LTANGGATYDASGTISIECGDAVVVSFVQFNISNELNHNYNGEGIL
jgi:hypothetical protein